MKKVNIFSWYFNQGVHELLEIWKNFLHFVWHFFAIQEMLTTLLYPWHRDVSPHNWRGFQPQKSIQLFIENMLSRLVGAVVRFSVLMFGLGVEIFFLIAGLIALMLWIGGPLLLIILLYYIVSGFLLWTIGLAIAALWILVVALSYFKDSEVSFLEISPEQLVQAEILERIAARLGLPLKRFPSEILVNDQALDDFLHLQGLARKDFAEILNWELVDAQAQIDQKKFWRWENLKKNPPFGMDWRYGFTPNLDRYATDLLSGDYSEYAQAELVGRGEELEMLRLLLSRPDQNCALLVGPSGIGKKTLVHAFAKNIRQGKEDLFATTRILNLDLARAISDAINRGEDVENAMRMLFYEAAFAGNIVLFIEHLEYFLGNSGSSFHPDISAVLNEFLNVPSFQIIALATTKEYHKLIEGHEHIVKYFEIVEIREPSENEAMEILLWQLKKYESSRVLFTYAALKKVVSDSNKHNWQFPLPERALDLMMDVLMFWEKKSDEQFISEATVENYLSLKTGVKHGEIEVDERKKLLNLEKMLHKLVIGQDEAIRQVSEALRRARSGIGDSQKPVGSFLFLGPTGVGKTETAKALAKIYFGDEKHLVRFDMSEFQMPSSIDRMLGSVERNEPGRLATVIKDNPYCLLLLDEIEKAYPEVLDIFLQILDEGYVTDAFGEKINFRNTLIIATSNAGGPLIKKMVEENNGEEEIKQAVIDYAIENNVFRTEFLNRFEGVIFFRPLNDNELVSVVRLQLQKLLRRIKEEKNIQVSFGESVVQRIIQKGYNPIFGARSLNRYIEDEVESILAKKIIAGEVTRGETIELNI